MTNESNATTPEQHSECSAIDREGPGSTPGSGSIVPIGRVPPIPRGPARRLGWLRDKWPFWGGLPRCPTCLDRGPIVRLRRCGSGDFMCNRCCVAWRDTRQALCFICDVPFFTDELRCGADRHSSGLCCYRTCYHINVIKHPFCPRCAALIGWDREHCRRQLRRMVGLRGHRHESEEDA